MYSPGTIAFWTLESVLILIAVAQCCIMWHLYAQRKKQRMNDGLRNSVRTASTTLDLENNGGREEALSRPGNEQSGDQPERRLELSLPSAWSANAERRPGSGYEGLEVVSQEMVQMKDFAVASSRPQVQQWSGENWTSCANGTPDTKQGQSAVPEQFHHQAPAQHESSGFLRPSPIAASRSPSPVSAFHIPDQFHLGRSMQYEVQRTEGPVSIHSGHSSVEIASPPPVVHRPRDHQGDPLLLRAFSTSLQAIQSSGNAEEEKSTIQELESPLQSVSVCSDPPRTGTQHQYRAYSPQLSIENQERGTHHAQFQQGKERQLDSLQSAPIHSRSSSLPTTGGQQGKIPSRTDDQQRSHRASPGRFSLNAFTMVRVESPKGTTETE